MDLVLSRKQMILLLVFLKLNRIPDPNRVAVFLQELVRTLHTLPLTLHIWIK